MATDKQPRNNAARKTTKENGAVPTTPKPVSTAGQPSGGTARNPQVQGNASLDMDEVRKRAYELYEESGNQGNQEEHWFRAEAELRARTGDQKRSA
jgi:DNA relaxase NicK